MLIKQQSLWWQWNTLKQRKCTKKMPNEFSEKLITVRLSITNDVTQDSNARFVFSAASLRYAESLPFTKAPWDWQVCDAPEVRMCVILFKFTVMNVNRARDLPEPLFTKHMRVEHKSGITTYHWLKSADTALLLSGCANPLISWLCMFRSYILF